MISTNLMQNITRHLSFFFPCYTFERYYYWSRLDCDKGIYSRVLTDPTNFTILALRSLRILPKNRRDIYIAWTTTRVVPLLAIRETAFLWTRRICTMTTTTTTTMATTAMVAMTGDAGWEKSALKIKQILSYFCPSILGDCSLLWSYNVIYTLLKSISEFSLESNSAIFTGKINDICQLNQWYLLFCTNWYHIGN